jgi:hypothetical protein
MEYETVGRQCLLVVPIVVQCRRLFVCRGSFDLLAGPMRSGAVGDWPMGRRLGTGHWGARGRVDSDFKGVRLEMGRLAGDAMQGRLAAFCCAMPCKYDGTILE